MSGTSWWRSPTASDQFAGHDYADFAQEFLRRNADYRREHAEVEAAMAESPADGARQAARLASRWGLCLPFAPDASPVDAPAQWSAETLSTVILQESEAHELQLPAQCDIRADSHLHDGRHLVIDSASSRFRLWLRPPSMPRQAMFLIPFAHEQLARAAMTARYIRLLWGDGDRASGAFKPTHYARKRLALFLALIDARMDGASTQDIARQLVFPRSALPRGAAWKGAGERRHTLRLMAQSQQMLRTGFRKLPGFIV